MESYFLPKKFTFSHNYCFFLHDQLVETLKSGEKANIFNSIIKFKKKKHAKQVQGLSGEEFVDWLEKNDYKADVYFLFYKQLCAALLSDYLHFIYEALQCSRKGKLTVAYALLRKPFKENLFYLEWLLARPNEFLPRFDSESSKRFSFLEDKTKDTKVKIIEEAMAKSRRGKWLPPEYLYELRYGKKADYGLEQSWQKANHLLTTHRHMKTEKTNLNFIFSNTDARYSQWEGIYSILPILLYHGVQVIEALLANFAKRAHEDKDITSLRTDVGMFLWMRESPWYIESKDLLKEIQSLFDKYKLNCESCKKAIKLGINNLKLLYSDGALKCYNCKKIYSLL